MEARPSEATVAGLLAGALGSVGSAVCQGPYVLSVLALEARPSGRPYAIATLERR